jgi:KaiC/GvpD/RAD55 family RecA-like ATPase
VEFDDTLEVYLDGKRLEWKSSKTLDRAFYTWNFPTGFTKGQHKISFKQGYPKSTSSAPIRQLCNVVLLEYPDSFRKNLDFVGAYPTRDINGKVSYRPTDDNCLMRNMERENFCPVCVEGLWLNLLKRISLIDGFKQNCNRIGNTVEVFPLKLGQFRVGADNNKDNKDLIIIKWFRKGKEVKKYRNENIITLDQSTVGEKWFVVVIFETPEIRQKSDLLISKQEFVVCI